MQVLIDTFSALGMVDYSRGVQFGKPTTIVRRLNQPSLCTLSLFMGGLKLPIPLVLAKLAIVDSKGLTLFTGYLSEEPLAHTVGQNQGDLVTTITLTAVSDEILMDMEQISTNSTLLGQSPQSSWETLTRLATNSLQVAVSDRLGASSRFTVRAGSRWSEAAGTLAAQMVSAYRCVSGVISAIPVGQSTHFIEAGDVGLSFKSIPVRDVRWLARDVTVCGKHEPTAYVTELFVGDGSSTSFNLTQQPFHPAIAQKASIMDLFQGTSLNERLWQVSDPGAHVALTQYGLTCNGGTGRDGESIVSAVQQIEVGGALTIEASGVSLMSASSGLLLPLYAGDVRSAACLAGFRVSSAGQEVTLTAEVFGALVGSSYNVQIGHIYALRLHVYSPEMERLRQSYATLTSQGPIVIGGDTVASGGQATLEIQDTTGGTAGATTVLFTGNLSDLPPSCILGLVNGASLNCSIKTVRCFQTAPMRVTIGPNAGSQAPLSLTTSAEGGSCHFTTNGSLQFYPAATPASNQLISVSYRLRGTAIARRRLPPTSGMSALPVTLNWIGSVAEPVAWSSNDCDAVASAILEAVGDGMPVLRGSYTSSSVESDIWPGDTLSIGPQEDGSTLNVVVQTSTIELLQDSPDVASTVVEFATSAIAGTGFKLSSAIPVDAALPQGPTNVKEALDSLKRLSVVNVTSTILTIATGAMPPINGGFEVRRRDLTFGPGADSDLVLRTSTTVISIPRSSPVEQFYIRMYDASEPCNYSQFSAAIFLNLPFGS